MPKRDFQDPLYVEWRKRVFARDKHRCQMPGCRRKRSLNAHHIQRWADQPFLRYEPDNGITLCWGCHRDVTNNERAYEGMFLEIARNNAKKSH